MALEPLYFPDLYEPMKQKNNRKPPAASFRRLPNLVSHGTPELSAGNAVLDADSQEADERMVARANEAHALPEVYESPANESAAIPLESSAVTTDAPEDDPAADTPLIASEALMYIWDIPGRERGYTFRIEVPDAAEVDVEEAREKALAVPFADPVMPDGQGKLNAVERHWIQTTEPRILRDTTPITLDHNHAARENARLVAENEQYAEIKNAFRAAGIDPRDPEGWAAAKLQEADGRIKAAREQDATLRQRLVNALIVAIKALETVIDETGYAPPKAAPPAEPDYSELTVLLPANRQPEEYPRLAEANMARLDPREPMTPLEEEGFSIVLRIMDDAARMTLSPGEEQAIRAYEHRMRANG